MKPVQESDPMRTNYEDIQTASSLDSLALSVSILYKAVSGPAANRAAAFGLTLSELSVIRLLSDDSEWTGTAVASALATGTSSVSRIVTGLVDRGLVNRRRPLGDRRVVLLKLTEKGAAVRLALLTEIQALERRVTQDIDSEDLEACIATFSRIVENYIELEDSL